MHGSLYVCARVYRCICMEVYIVALGPVAPRCKCMSLLLSAMGGGVGGS